MSKRESSTQHGGPRPNGASTSRRRNRGTRSRRLQRWARRSASAGGGPSARRTQPTCMCAASLSSRRKLSSSGVTVSIAIDPLLVVGLSDASGSWPHTGKEFLKVVTAGPSLGRRQRGQVGHELPVPVVVEVQHHDPT